jgi:glycosyltransferase involved in cell wall biosynthesis
MEIKKIAWITGCLGGRGVTVVVEQAAKAVAALSGHEVHIVCVHELPDDYPRVPGVQVHCLNLPRGNPEAACRELHAWIESAQPDVVLWNDTPAVEAYWPYLPAKIKSIGVLHDHAYGWRRPFVDARESLDGVAAVSRFVMEALEKDFHEYPGVLRTIDNGTTYPPEKERSPHTGPLRLVFFGAIDRQKGAYDLPKLLEACRSAGIDCSLRIIGGVDASLQADVAKAAGPIAVEWAGRLPREDCFERLAEADVFLALSRGESFGLTTVEAMAMGCVPVGYADGGTQEIVVEGASGYLVPTCEYAALGQRLLELAEDRDLLEKMGRQACHRARTVYTLEAMGERYFEMIEAVLSAEAPVKRKDFDQFKLPRQKHRLYATYVPAPVRKFIGRTLAASPRLEKIARKYKGI